MAIKNGRSFCFHRLRLNSVNGSLELGKGSLQCRFWTGNIKSFKALALGTEHGAAVQPEFGVIDDHILQSILGQAQFPEIQPYKIGSFWLDKFYLW